MDIMIITTITVTEKRKKKTRKKGQNQLQNKLKYKNNNKCFSWVSAVSILFLAFIHSPPSSS